MVNKNIKIVLRPENGPPGPLDIFIILFNSLKRSFKSFVKGIHNITKDVLKTFLRCFFVHLLGVRNFLKQKHPREYQGY